MLEMKKKDRLAQNAAVPFVFIKDTVTAAEKSRVRFKHLSKINILHTKRT